MADSKISALDNLTAADPANDMIPIVDVSATPPASGNTKRISINNLLACSPSATLASATITGDLTVRTNKLAVTSSGVGFGTTTPAYPAHFRTTSPVIAIQDDTSAATGVGGVMNFLGFTSGTSGANIFAQIKGVKTAGSAGGEYQVFTSDSAGNSIQRYLIDSTGISTWSVAGTTAMTLNSTGLGVGRSPSYKLDIAGVGNFDQLRIAAGSATKIDLVNSTTAVTYSLFNANSASNGFDGFGIFNGTSYDFRIVNGNLGIGVTPSAWSASFKSAQVGSRLVLTTTGSDTFFGNNFYNDGAYKFINADFATYYDQTTGKHVWGTSTTSGAVNGVITWNAAMTLDASGNLLVGVTSALASGSTFQNLGSARQVLTLKGNDATSYTLGIWSATTTGDNLFAYFGTEATLTVRGGISYNRGGGLVAYNTTSDYRAKDIIGPVSNSGSLIDSLKVYVGKMKGATIERPMLIAHEAQEVAPYAVTGTKDEVDADGNPKYQQMDVSALVPVLIAEIQSLRARVQTLEAK